MALARRQHLYPSPDTALVIATGALAGWGLIYPVPYALCIALLGFGAVAVLGLPRLTDGYFRLEEKSELIADAGHVSLFLSAVLVLRALIDVETIDWEEPLLLAGLSGLLFAGLALMADPLATRSWTCKSVTSMTLSFFVIGVGFGWGSVIEANMLLDRSVPTTHRLRVTEKWEAGRATRRHLYVATPNDLGVDEVNASDRVYEHAAVGGEVCAQRSDGAFGFRWYWVETCPTAAAP